MKKRVKRKFVGGLLHGETRSLSPDTTHYKNREDRETYYLIGGYMCEVVKLIPNFNGLINAAEGENYRPAFVIEPECHGNGGWCGSEVLGQDHDLDTVLSQGLTRINGEGNTEVLHWTPEYSPYDGRILNNPRISPDHDPNHATHMWDPDSGEWRALNK